MKISRLESKSNWDAAIRKVIPRRGKEFWHSLDPDDLKQVVEAVMSEVKLKTAQIHHKDQMCTAYDRSDPNEVHYSAG